jgi:hypothetical protein
MDTTAKLNFWAYDNADGDTELGCDFTCAEEYGLLLTELLLTVDSRRILRNENSHEYPLWAGGWEGRHDLDWGFHLTHDQFLRIKSAYPHLKYYNTPASWATYDPAYSYLPQYRK